MAYSASFRGAFAREGDSHKRHVFNFVGPDSRAASWGRSSRGTAAPIYENGWFIKIVEGTPAGTVDSGGFKGTNFELFDPALAFAGAWVQWWRGLAAASGK